MIERDFPTTVVLGAGGQLGSTLCRRLGPAAVPMLRGGLDWTDDAVLARTIAERRPGLIINCAAYTAVDRAETEAEAAFRVNADLVERLVGLIAGTDCRLVHVSSDYVYCGARPLGRPFRETDPPSPRGVYARSKWAGEQMALRSDNSLVVRTCGLYAAPTPEKAHGNFVETMLRLGRDGKTPRVVADQTCTPTSVADFADGLLRLARTDATGLVHLTNAGAVAWRDFAAEVYRLAEMPIDPVPITTAEFGAVAPRPAYSVLDCGRYHELTGHRPRSWQDALAEYLAAKRASSGPVTARA